MINMLDRGVIRGVIAVGEKQHSVRLRDHAFRVVWT